MASPSDLSILLACQTLGMVEVWHPPNSADGWVCTQSKDEQLRALSPALTLKGKNRGDNEAASQGGLNIGKHSGLQIKRIVHHKG